MKDTSRIITSSQRGTVKEKEYLPEHILEAMTSSLEGKFTKKQIDNIKQKTLDGFGMSTV
ncbi:hypothetical protein [Amphritea balenae]|uniref:Uncharacterized protein n=1 Tax=Amphritea balenae TaxID=452629 RepID=A0A3P1SLY7_9GAMM|nr:hypothetical protein [Amphritea balenae]RRC98263.1 hypothetical protein EHS89_14320 [Amphritea balenae]GGK80477.1 hypothetical protein GCM10007941_33560 [Amphritea balenae]